VVGVAVVVAVVALKPSFRRNEENLPHIPCHLGMGGPPQ
jgi:hypothetical protein